MEKEDLIKYWLDSAKMDFKTMENLYQMEEYPWSLFLGQLVLEKVLKAIYSKNVGSNAPRIHDLNRLALSAKVEVPQKDKDDFDAISMFNLNTRYPDAKLSFYRKCTKEYTTAYIEKIKDLYTWLTSLTDQN